MPVPTYTRATVFLACDERDGVVALNRGRIERRAKKLNRRFGRPPSLTPHQRREAMERLAQGAAQAELARSYGVSQSTISSAVGARGGRSE
jgi:DNA-binding CsgD family transcriptional regulator